MSNQSISGPTFTTECKAVTLERALYGAGIGLIHQDGELAIRYAENLPEHFDVSAGLIGMDDRALFGEDDGRRLVAIKAAVLKSGEPTTTEIECKTPEGLKIYELKLQQTRDGERLGVLSIISDVTDSRHRERVLKSLLRELSHRSKNLLAIIQGIAMQTARHTISLDYFLVKFRGRLQSLSNSQDLVTDSSWRGAYLFELAEKQFAPYWPDRARPLRVQGVNAHLTPNAAVHLGLALHELFVNSATHGAIAAGSTTISIDCRKLTYEGHDAIEVVWTELTAGGRHNSDFDDKSFGRAVLERVAPSSVNGRSAFTLEPHRIEYRLTIPDTEFELIGQAS